MWRTLGAMILGTGVCLAGIVPASADDQKTAIKGGIEGHVKMVDVAGKKLIITTAQGRERTFTITDDTTMVGPRGGKVRRHLKDPRFREGFPVTIVAEGTTAEEVHLGFAKACDRRKERENGRAGNPHGASERNRGPSHAVEEPDHASRRCRNDLQEQRPAKGSHQAGGRR